MAEEALRRFQEALRKGISEATVELALLLCEGQDLPRDVEGAKKLLYRVEGKPRGRIYAELATLYEQGLGVPMDLKAAHSYHQWALQEGWQEAKKSLRNYIRVEGQLQWIDGQRYPGEVQGKAAAGDLSACFQQGFFLLDPHSRYQVPEAVLKWLEQAASQGQGGAARLLAHTYLHGISTKWGGKWVLMYRRPDLALNWLRRAAELGELQARLCLAGLGLWGQLPDIGEEERFSWCQEAAQEGLPKAQLELAERYATGKGVLVDGEKARHWALLAASQGEPRGLGLLACMYREGLGVSQDHEEASLWMRRAAEAGDPAEAYRLALSYESGEDRPPDPQEALRWYLASEPLSGEEEVLLPVLRLYLNGPPSIRDRGQALYWYLEYLASLKYDDMTYCYLDPRKPDITLYPNEEAIREFGQGDFACFADEYQDLAQASLELARRFEGGDGVAQDFQQSLRWYLEAASLEPSNPVAAQQAWLRAACLLQGREGLPPDEHKELACYLRACKSLVEKREAFFETFESIGENWDLDRELVPMAGSLAEAAARGDGEAQLSLFLWFVVGRAIPRNDALAEAWRLRALRKVDLHFCLRCALKLSRMEEERFHQQALQLFRACAAPVRELLVSGPVTQLPPTRFSVQMEQILESAGLALKRSYARHEPLEASFLRTSFNASSEAELRIFARSRRVSLDYARYGFESARLRREAASTQDAGRRGALLRQAADLGDPKAMAELAMLCIKTREGIQALQETYAWYTLSITAGGMESSVPISLLDAFFFSSQRQEAQDLALEWWQEARGLRILDALAGPCSEGDDATPT